MGNNNTLISKFEKAGLVTVITVWLLRAWLGPGMNYTALVGTTLLSVYYLWFGFFIFNKLKPLDLLRQETTRKLSRFSITASIIMGVIISYTLIAILFGIFFFPGMQAVMVSAFTILVAFSLYIAVYQKLRKRRSEFCTRYFKRAALIGFFLLVLIAMPMEKRLSIFFRDHPGFIEAYLEYRQNPGSEEATDRLREERSRFR